MHYDNNTGQHLFPRPDGPVQDAALIGDVLMGGLGLREMARDRQRKISAMTPPERETFRRRTPLRVARRIGWTALWAGLLMIIFNIPLPGIFATIVLIGLPLALFVTAAIQSRRFWATRQRAWDSWFRSRGSSLGEVRAWWPAAAPEERWAFINEWGLAAWNG